MLLIPGGMDLSPTERREVLKMVATMIVDEIRAQAGGDFAAIVTIPLSAAAHMLHKSTKQLPLLIPVTDIGPNSKVVTLRALQDHIKKNTRHPSAAVE